MIFIYTKKKKTFYKFKRSQFYKSKICFLNYIVWVQELKIENKNIKIVKNWYKLKLV